MYEAFQVIFITFVLPFGGILLIRTILTRYVFRVSPKKILKWKKFSEKFKKRIELAENASGIDIFLTTNGKDAVKIKVENLNNGDIENDFLEPKGETIYHFLELEENWNKKEYVIQLENTGRDKVYADMLVSFRLTKRQNAVMIVLSLIAIIASFSFILIQLQL